MKTWDIDFSGSRVEAVGPRGEFVKTSDHFEAVGEYDRQVRDLTAQVKLLQELRARDLTELSALVERLRKGDVPQPPPRIGIRTKEWRPSTLDGVRDMIAAHNVGAIVKQDGREWIVTSYTGACGARDLTDIVCTLTEVVRCT